jgi:hypothetical protein
MKLLNVSLIVMGIGLFLMLFGLIWPSLAPDRAFWSEEEAEAYQAAAAKAHHLGHARGPHGPPTDGGHEHLGPSPAAEKEYQEALTESKRLMAERDAAIAARDNTGGFFRWTGTVLIFLGLAGYGYVRFVAT